MKPKYKNELFKTLQANPLGLESFSFEELLPDANGYPIYNFLFGK